MGIRSSRADEIAGLDLPEMGMLAYPSFAVSSLDSVNGQEAVSAETDINTNEDR